MDSMDSTRSIAENAPSSDGPNSAADEILHPVNDDVIKPTSDERETNLTKDDQETNPVNNDNSISTSSPDLCPLSDQVNGASTTDPNIACDQEHPNVASDQEYPNITNDQEHPNVASDQEHPNIANDQEHPNVASDQEHHNIANDQEHPNVASDIESPNSANSDETESSCSADGLNKDSEKEALLHNQNGSVLPSSQFTDVDPNNKDANLLSSDVNMTVLHDSDEMVADQALAKKDRFANIKLFIVIYCVLLMFYMSQNIYNIGVIRTIERKYGLRSAQSGFIMSMNDISHIMVVIFVGYFGKNAHKPRFMSISLLLCAVAAFLMASPYFIYGDNPSASPTPTPLPAAIPFSPHPGNLTYTAYHIDASGHQMDDSVLCDSERPESECTEQQIEEDSANMVAYYIMLTAQFISGAGGSGITTLGFSYIDENSPSHKSPLYLGMVSSMFSFAPVAALGLAALCLRLPENPSSSTTLETGDPQWIGCWWLGYVICAVGIVLSCIPMWFFPKNIIKHPKTAEQKERENMTVKQQLKDFPKCTMALLTNLPYMFFALMTVLLMYVVIGLYSNLPRYIEIHFHKPAFLASFIAISGAAAGVLGAIGGGLVMNKRKMKPKGALEILVAMSTLMCIGIAISMGLGCPQLQMDGVWQEDGQFTVSTPCNEDCACPTARNAYQPVCGQDGLTYFSACHAACTAAINGTYSGCGCVLPSDTRPPSDTAEAGTCGIVCNMLIPYIIIFGIMSLAGSIGRAPSTIVLFRIVGDDQRSFALGICSFLANLLACIPAPVIFGAIVDSTCILWSVTCSGTGNCLLYDSKKFRLAIHGGALIFKVLALICTIIIYILIKDRVFQEKEELIQATKEKEEKSLDEKSINGKSEYKRIDEETPLQESEAVV